MVVRFRSWWQQIKQHWVAIGVVAIVLLAVIVLIIVGYKFDWTGFNGNNKSGKTLWDWLQLLIIPFVLAAGGYLFTFTTSRNERKAADLHNQTERDIAQDNQREAALQEYIDKMSELLLHEKLRESSDGHEVRNIARVRTLTVLPRLDRRRKRSVLNFLGESGLIIKGKKIVDLYGADLREASLHRADLHGADLSSANLSSADLHGANLSFSNLSKADLSFANLSSANLSSANLVGANLWGAKLIFTILAGADLSKTEMSDVDLSNAEMLGANLTKAIVTNEQLDTAKSLKGAIMPDGSIHP